jgi:hypothetical protein
MTWNLSPCSLEIIWKTDSMTINSMISAKKVLFIKLGATGKFEHDCIENEPHTIRLDYSEADHELCLAGKWDELRSYYLTQTKTTPGAASNHVNQIKAFYNAGDDTLWITFYNNKLWWCFAETGIELISEDNTKVRKVIGGWSDKDINGKELLQENLSGKLLKTQGYRGTICTVEAANYALAKINGKKLEEVTAVEKALADLQAKVARLLTNLQWQDFETLIDLIFRQAGWQRLGVVGKAQKTIDLSLFAPVTGEKAIVQIKGESDIKDFEDYISRFEGLSQYDKFFYVVHSPTESLLHYHNQSPVSIYFADKIAELAISAGLVNWVVEMTD